MKAAWQLAVGLFWLAAIEVMQVVILFVDAYRGARRSPRYYPTGGHGSWKK